MKILFLCNKPPYPPVEGGSIAMNALITGLLDAGQEVKVWALSSEKFRVNLADIPESYRAATQIRIFPITLNFNFIEAVKSIIWGKSFQAQRFFNTDCESQLKALLLQERFDIIQLESVFMAPYLSCIRANSPARVIIRTHNVEHLIWKQLAKETQNPLRKWTYLFLSHNLKKYEISCLNECDGIAAISAQDADIFKKLGVKTPIRDIPFGMDISEEEDPTPEVIPLSLFHLGSMNWLPNQLGIKWFIEQVFPLVRKEFPSVKLFIAGRAMPQDFILMQEKGIEVLSEVDDARKFMEDKMLMVVPLYSGSGVRIKIMEGMLLKKTVIATSVAASGVPYVDNQHLMIADSAETFLEKIRCSFNSPEFCRQIGTRASGFIRSHYNNRVIVAQLLDLYRELIHHNKT